jgi:ABC-type branched-subunit amino acid transport system ATPase component
MITVEGVTVRFGGVVPLDRADLSVEEGVRGLIGPNGAGKTTFLNVLSGFVTPVEGRVEAFGQDLLALPPFRRVRWGLRRTFQTEQAVADLSVRDNVLTVLEHSGWPSSGRRAAVDDAIDLVGLGARADTTVGVLGAAERRMVELARAVVGSPRLILLDEPAAGLPDEETAALADIILAIPERTEALTILVDHDIDLVAKVCATTTVLDFGRVIADGPTPEVLADPSVMTAYLGTTDEGDVGPPGGPAAAPHAAPAQTEGSNP